MRWTAGAVVAVLMLLTALTVPALAQPTARPENPNVVVNASTRYVFDTEAGSVLVSVEYLLVNSSTDVPVTQLNESLPLDARDIVVRSGSQPLGAVRIGTAGDTGKWIIPLVTVLRPGRSVGVSLNYTLLTDDPSDPESTVVINPAYISMSVSSVGGPGGVHSVEITMPSGFKVVDSPGFVDVGNPDSLVLVDAGASAPYSQVRILATNTSNLEMTVVPDLGVEMDVKGWPDHSAWSRLISDASSSIVPQLTDWFGPPAVEAIEIMEGSVAAYPGLVIGDPVGGRVWLVVAPTADAGDIGRQLAGVWMGAVLPDVPWFGAAAVDSFGTTAARTFDPEASSPDENTVGFDSTAHVVVDSLLGEIGGENLAGVISAVEAGEFTYPGPGADEAEPLPSDWHTLLDTLRIKGGSVNAESLFRQILTEPSELDSLDQHTSALARYDKLTSEAGGWKLPIWVRLPLAEWDFDRFDARRVDIEATLADATLLSEEGDTAQIDLGEYVKNSFERATTGMDDTNSLIVDQRMALDAILETRSVIESNSGLISRIGLIGTDVAARRSEIEGSFRAGRFDITRELSRNLIKTIEGSGARGVLRLVVPSLVITAIGFLIAEVVKRRGSGSGSGGEEALEPGS